MYKEVFLMRRNVEAGLRSLRAVARKTIWQMDPGKWRLSHQAINKIKIIIKCVFKEILMENNWSYIDMACKGRPVELRGHRRNILICNEASFVIK